MIEIELLAPARDLECGVAAIDCGADAVYIGATRFGARAQAGNPLADIEALARYAHRYWARVYVTVNTLLYDHELPDAVRLIHKLYQAGVDALIVQDVGLLECDLPPLPLIASTQMHNDTPAKVAFLEQVGFWRVILARELSLEQIHAIRQQTTIELEAFVHGALCVSYSGQCYMSHAMGGRSGNRGECAQPCRRRYSLVDREGTTLASDRHLLSLRDLDLSDHLADLIGAGVSSFKIEGRLKDKAYVMNVVSAYRQRLDQVERDMGLHKSSSGQSQVDFVPNLAKTFNRGYTTHFFRGRSTPPGSIDTPKMTGEYVGRVVAVSHRAFRLDAQAPLHNGDGLCFFDPESGAPGATLRGTVVNGVRGEEISVDRIDGIKEGTVIYRNHDHVFLGRMENSRPVRKIAVRLTLAETSDGVSLTAADEDGNSATGTLDCAKERAHDAQQMLANLHRQLGKMGDTEFTCQELQVAWPEAYFLPFSALNELRRRTLAQLVEVRAQNRPVLACGTVTNGAAYPQRQLTYLGNVLNQQAAAFYRRHGVTDIEPAAESGLDMQDRQVMRTRYCVRHQLGFCDGQGSASALKEPLYLVDEEGHRHRLHFDCAKCEMTIFYSRR